MNFNQLAKLRELKKKYGFELQCMLQSSNDHQLNPDETLKTLLTLELDRSMVKCINEIGELYNDRESLEIIFGLFAKTYGQLLGRYAKNNNDADSLEKLFNQLFQHYISEALKDES